MWWNMDIDRSSLMTIRVHLLLVVLKNNNRVRRMTAQRPWRSRNSLNLPQLDPDTKAGSAHRSLHVPAGQPLDKGLAPVGPGPRPVPSLPEYVEIFLSPSLSERSQHHVLWVSNQLAYNRLIRINNHLYETLCTKETERGRERDG